MEAFERVLLLGDAVPKTNLVCDLLTEAQKVQFREWMNTHYPKVSLYSCESVSSLEQRKDEIVIQSPWIPQGLNITVLFENADWTGDDYDQVLFIQPYPFTLKDFNQELEKIRKHLFARRKLRIASYKVLFYRDYMQKSVSGESDTIELVLQNAPKQLEEELKKTADSEMITKLLQYRVYQHPKDMLSILHGSSNTLQAVTEISMEHLRDWEYDLNDFTEPYGEYQKCLMGYPELTSENLNDLTRFEKVKGSPDVPQRYFELYCESYQEKISSFVKEVYEGMIRPVCFWDLERDTSYLIQNVHKLLRTELIVHMSEKIPCPPDKAAYTSIIRNQYECDTKFLQAAQKFITSKLMDYIYQYLRKKEELLSGYLKSSVTNE